VYVAAVLTACCGGIGHFYWERVARTA
jgi:hypothetical protein